MGNDPLTVQLAPADYAVAERHIGLSLRRQGRWYWPLRVIGVAIGLLAVLGFIGLFSYEAPGTSGSAHAVRNSTLMLLAACALAWLAAVLYKRSVAGVLFKTGSRLLQPYSVALNEVGIAVASASGTASIPWSAVLRVELEGNHLFIYTVPNYALVIPAHAFPGRAEFAAYAKLVSEMQAQHAA